MVEFYFEHGDLEFLAKFDHYSLKDYLHLRGNLSLGAIELIGGSLVHLCCKKPKIGYYFLEQEIYLI